MEMLLQREWDVQVLRAGSGTSLVFLLPHRLQQEAHQDHCPWTPGRRERGGHSLRTFAARAQDRLVHHNIHIHNLAVLGAWGGIRTGEEKKVDL